MSGNRHYRLLVLALVACSLATACEDDAMRPEPPDSGTPAVPITLEWQHPFPQGNNLRHLWGFDDGTFYAVGDGGTILHYDGSNWTFVDTPIRQDLQRLWGDGPDDVYAAGFGGTLIHFNGMDWKSIATPTTTDLYAVCANGSDDIFITGVGGSVWNYHEGAWKEYMVAPGERLRSLWSYAHDDVYACGTNGAFMRFDGATWNELPYPFDPPREECRDLWGTGPGSIGVQAGNIVAWCDGTSWRRLTTGPLQAYGFWGVSTDTVVVVAAGLISHYNGGNELYLDSPTPDPLYDVWGLTANDYFAVGRWGRIAHFDGAAWSLVSRGRRRDLHDVSITGTDGIAVGAGGLILRQSGDEWTEESVDPDYELAGVWSGPGLSVAVGRYTPRGQDRSQAIFMNTGGGWTAVGEVGAAHRLFDVWGSAANDVYAVGWAGEIVHYDGSNWGVASPENGGEIAYLRAVDGTGTDNVLAVGRTNDLRGLVRRYDGTSWTSTLVPDVEELCGVWVESPSLAIAVGSFGSIVRFDGTGWSSMPSPTVEKLFTVWGSGSTDVYAAGWMGTLLHFDGSSWTRYVPATGRTFNGIGGRAGDGVWFVGDGGSILFSPGL